MCNRAACMCHQSLQALRKNVPKSHKLSYAVESAVGWQPGFLGSTGGKPPEHRDTLATPNVALCADCIRLGRTGPCYSSGCIWRELNASIERGAAGPLQRVATSEWVSLNLVQQLQWHVLSDSVGEEQRYLNQPTEGFVKVLSHFMFNLDETCFLALEGNLQVIADKTCKKNMQRTRRITEAPFLLWGWGVQQVMLLASGLPFEWLINSTQKIGESREDGCAIRVCCLHDWYCMGWSCSLPCRGDSKFTGNVNHNNKQMIILAAPDHYWQRQ